MAANDYHFETRWRVKARVEDISGILGDPLDLPRWWPQVYLSVREPEPGVFDLRTKGWLPYHLRWKFRRTESRHPFGFSLTAWGDFEGQGVWNFKQDGEWADIQYLWTVRASKPLLRNLSFLLKPVFSANHRWAMARGEESLQRELARRMFAGA